MTALNGELPDAILTKISLMPQFVQQEYLLDCLQETRFSYFKSSTFLLRPGVSREYVEAIQRKFSRFLVYTAREWFISIPALQSLGNPFIEQYLRLMLCELLERNIIQETEGWNYYLLHTSLIYWSLSPVAGSTIGGELITNFSSPSPQLKLPSVQKQQTKEPRCVYCENKWPCMAKDKRNCHHSKFCCFIQGGVHLCKTHGQIIMSQNRPLGTNVQLEDGRRIWGIGDHDFIDRYGVKFFDHEKVSVRLNDFGEYTVFPSPRSMDWFMSEPDDLEETELRVRSTEKYPPQSFWGDDEGVDVNF
jgi:hypothetical protein